MLGETEGETLGLIDCEILGEILGEKDVPGEPPGNVPAIASP